MNSKNKEPLSSYDQALAFIKTFSTKNKCFPLPSDIAKQLDMTDDGALKILRKMVEYGDVEKISRFHWALTAKHLKD